MFSCTLCQKTFSLKGTLTRHLKMHNASAEKYKCEKCDFTSVRLDNLRRHVTIKHEKIVSDGSRISFNVACVLCNDFSCALRSDMVKHYESEHDVIFADKVSLSFENEEKFKDWKLSVEKSDLNQFVRDTGMKKTATGKFKLVFNCFRTGTFQSRSETGERHEKLLGSNKINGYCPARIEATVFETGEVCIDYYKTHVGHTNDLGRMRLPKPERDEIAQKLRLRIPPQSIIDSIRDTTPIDGAADRYHLLVKKDIRNIARDYHVEFDADAMRHKNDSTSVHSWVQEQQSTGSTVIFYKPQGSLSEEFPLLKEEDFVLIIMTDAQQQMLKQFGEKMRLHG